ncbi:MAG: undecaprenyl-diphosphatase UppP [Bacteroidota bacterium]
MSIFEATILGIIQGLSEFLPISSTAHLTIAGKFFGLINPDYPERWTAFIAVTQFGTLFSVLYYFSKDIFSISKNFFTDGFSFLKNPKSGLKEARLGWYLILGTLPIATVGLYFKKIIEGNLTKDFFVIGCALIILAIVLFLAEKISTHTRKIENANWIDALLIGIGQMFALIPGASRSGTTLTAGLFLGFARSDAARFSFLLSLPAVLASGMLELYQMKNFISEIGIANIFASIASSAIVGYFAIDFLIKYLKTHTTYIFIIYRIALGAILIFLFK